ncbi:MAG: hypothetical protein ABIS00_05965 [Gemmatimonadales bacterium]
MRPLLTLLLLTQTAPLVAQESWRSGNDLELVRRAVAHRLSRDADTLLSAWQATARGMVRFASEVDHGSGPVERVIRADELRVEVYGEAPNRSKQIVVAWRDTSFLPNRVRYHRDHLGIVANDFGGVIRLGDGDEVRDLIHPLSPAGLGHYQFRLGDTLTLAAAKGVVRVVAVEVRPVDRASSAAVGTLYLDVDRAALVRFRFTFTPASYRDPTVENITVTLENALQENARWLPWRQSIVIRRGSPLLDLPVRTVLRADWSLSDYTLGVTHPATRFTGPLVAGLRGPAPDTTWGAPLALRLDLLPATAADVAEAESEAMRALGGRLIDGLPGTRLAARGVSELVHVNRVEGVTLELGARVSAGRGITARAHGGFGFSDLRAVGRLSLEKTFGTSRLSLAAERTIADIAAAPVISGALNSIRTALHGDDLGDYVMLERLRMSLSFPAGSTRIDLSAAEQWSTSVATEFSPIAGSIAPNPSLGAGRATVLAGSVRRRAVDGDGWTLDVEAGSGDRDWVRTAFDGRTSMALGGGALQLHLLGGFGTGELPGYRTFVAGGRGTLPGLPFRGLGGRRLALVDLGWARPIGMPSPPIPNARRIPLPSALGPFVAAAIAGGGPAVIGQPTGRIEPVAGLRLDLWGPLLRIEAGVALRTGHVGITLDVHPDWWPVL